MRYLITFLFLAFMPLVGFSQCDSSQWAQPGTYELIKIQTSTEADISNTVTYLTEEQLCLIEAARKNHHFAYLNLDLYTRVKIYPKYEPLNHTER